MSTTGVNRKNSKCSPRPRPKQPIDRIIEAAKILRPGTAYVPQAAEFDGDKINALKNIVKEAGFSLSEFEESDLIERTYWAVVDLAIADAKAPTKIAGKIGSKAKAPTKPSAQKQSLNMLRALHCSAMTFAHQWGEVMQDSGLRSAIRSRLQGLSRQKEEASLTAEALLARGERLTRIDAVFDHDIWALAGEIGPLVKALESCGKSPNVWKYLFVWNIARAWHENTHKCPSLSRNDGVNDPLGTPFQRFTETALSPCGDQEQAKLPPLGSGIIRSAIDAYREAWGDET